MYENYLSYSPTMQREDRGWGSWTFCLSFEGKRSEVYSKSGGYFLFLEFERRPHEERHDTNLQTITHSGTLNTVTQPPHVPPPLYIRVKHSGALLKKQYTSLKKKKKKNCYKSIFKLLIISTGNNVNFLRIKNEETRKGCHDAVPKERESAIPRVYARWRHGRASRKIRAHE